MNAQYIVERIGQIALGSAQAAGECGLAGSIGLRRFEYADQVGERLEHALVPSSGRRNSLEDFSSRLIHAELARCADLDHAHALIAKILYTAAGIGKRLGRCLEAGK